MNKLVLLLVAVLLVFSSVVLACTEVAPPDEKGPPKQEFIVVGTGGSSAGNGSILLYRFYAASQPNPFPTQQTPTVVASFGNGTVQGLDIFDGDGDNDLDFIALVRYETSANTDKWFYELYFYENQATGFLPHSIWSPLPIVDKAWNAALADSTAADFDSLPDNLIDFIVSIGNATATMIYKFKNTGGYFTYQGNPLTEVWATHARRMDTADFNGDGMGDFAIFDYPYGGDFNDDIVIRYHGPGPFGNPNDFLTPYFFTNRTPASIATITAGQFDSDNWPDVIVGGDDDGDPGRYWLYGNNGTGGFQSAPVEVFDLNPQNDTGQGKPGAGVADAYDFDANGVADMDVVATAGDMSGNTTSPNHTTIWYIRRTGPGTFAVNSTGFPIPPSAIIDIITTAQYGNVWSIAAPMTTNFGVG